MHGCLDVRNAAIYMLTNLTGLQFFFAEGTSWSIVCCQTRSGYTRL